jgi:hypothetical protein
MKSGRFENLVAGYYRGVCTFASRLTGDRVEAVLLTTPHSLAREGNSGVVAMRSGL